MMPQRRHCLKTTRMVKLKSQEERGNLAEIKNNNSNNKINNLNTSPRLPRPRRVVLKSRLKLLCLKVEQRANSRGVKGATKELTPQMTPQQLHQLNSFTREEMKLRLKGKLTERKLPVKLKEKLRKERVKVPRKKVDVDVSNATIRMVPLGISPNPGVREKKKRTLKNLSSHQLTKSSLQGTGAATRRTRS